MAKLLVLYKTPSDKAAFDRHYREVHIPLASKLPGLTRYDVSEGEITAAQPSDTYLIAILHFPTVADLRAALASPEGQATSADRRAFAPNGADVFIFEDSPVD